MLKNSPILALLCDCIVRGIVILAGIAPLAAEDLRRSGTSFLTPELRAIQNEETTNPGLFSILEGESLWLQKDNGKELACADCHGGAKQAMAGVSARYPAFSPILSAPIDLSGRVNLCRSLYQGAEILAHESTELLALTALINHQSREMPIITGEDPQLAPYIAKGRALFFQRMGQIDLACADCHNDHWADRLGGSSITQAHPTGYPVYRLEWQATGSLQRRMRNCLSGVRADPFPYDAPEWVMLELFLMDRARGMLIETLAVRP